MSEECGRVTTLSPVIVQITSECLASRRQLRGTGGCYNTPWPLHPLCRSSYRVSQVADLMLKQCTQEKEYQTRYENAGDLSRLNS